MRFSHCHLNKLVEKATVPMWLLPYQATDGEEIALVSGTTGIGIISPRENTGFYRSTLTPSLHNQRDGFAHHKALRAPWALFKESQCIVDLYGLQRVECYHDQESLSPSSDQRNPGLAKRWENIHTAKPAEPLSRIKKGDESKTAFRTRCGLFKY